MCDAELYQYLVDCQNPVKSEAHTPIDKLYLLISENDHNECVIIKTFVLLYDMNYQLLKELIGVYSFDLFPKIMKTIQYVCFNEVCSLNMMIDGFVVSDKSTSDCSTPTVISESVFRTGINKIDYCKMLLVCLTECIPSKELLLLCRSAMNEILSVLKSDTLEMDISDEGVSEVTDPMLIVTSVILQTHVLVICVVDGLVKMKVKFGVDTAKYTQMFCEYMDSIGLYLTELFSILNELDGTSMDSNGMEDGVDDEEIVSVEFEQWKQSTANGVLFAILSYTHRLLVLSPDVCQNWNVRAVDIILDVEVYFDNCICEARSISNSIMMAFEHQLQKSKSEFSSCDQGGEMQEKGRNAKEIESKLCLSWMSRGQRVVYTSFLLEILHTMQSITKWDMLDGSIIDDTNANRSFECPLKAVLMHNHIAHMYRYVAGVVLEMGLMEDIFQYPYRIKDYLERHQESLKNHVKSYCEIDSFQDSMSLCGVDTDAFYSFVNKAMLSGQNDANCMDASKIPSNIDFNKPASIPWYFTTNPMLLASVIKQLSKENQDMIDSIAGEEEKFSSKFKKKSSNLHVDADAAMRGHRMFDCLFQDCGGLWNTTWNLYGVAALIVCVMQPQLFRLIKMNSQIVDSPVDAVGTDIVSCSWIDEGSFWCSLPTPYSSQYLVQCMLPAVLTLTTSNISAYLQLGKKLSIALYDGIIATPLQNQVTDSTKTNISMSVLMRVQHNTNPHLHPNPLVFLPSMLPIRIECDSLTLLNASYPCYLTAVDLENFESDEKKWRLNGSLHKFTCTWKQWQSSSLNTVAICLALLRLMVISGTKTQKTTLDICEVSQPSCSENASRKKNDISGPNTDMVGVCRIFKKFICLVETRCRMLLLRTMAVDSNVCSGDTVTRALLLDIVKGLLQYEIQKDRERVDAGNFVSPAACDPTTKLSLETGNTVSRSVQAITMELEYCNRGPMWHQSDTATYLYWFVLVVCRQKIEKYFPKQSSQLDPTTGPNSNPSSLIPKHDKQDLLDDTLQHDFISSVNIGMILCAYWKQRTHRCGVTETLGAKAMQDDVNDILIEMQHLLKVINDFMESEFKQSKKRAVRPSLLQMNIALLLDHITSIVT